MKVYSRFIITVAFFSILFMLSIAFSQTIGGAVWTAMNPEGIAGVEGHVKAFASSNTIVYIGGSFKIAGNRECNNVARWDGISWKSLGSGMNSSVTALVCDSSGDLIAGGYFSNADGVPVARIAKWNGLSWSSLGGGISSGYVSSLAFDKNGVLYCGGDFDSAGGVPVNNIAKWDGTAWSAMGIGCNGTVNALAIDSNGILYVGGLFDSTGGILTSGVARWNGTSWNSMGTGINKSTLYSYGVQAIAIDNNGNCYVGGNFSQAGAVSTRRIAKWNGSTWSALGNGVKSGVHIDPWDKSRYTTPDFVSSLAFDSLGNLYAAGSFDTAGTVAASNVAKWDGSVWSPVGTGVVRAANVIGLGKNGGLYTGWNSNSSDIAEVGNFATWDGLSWRYLGNGTNASVNDIAIGISGQLYIAGKFTFINNQSVNCIARWDGNKFNALGTGLSAQVVSITGDHQENLYACGFSGNGDQNNLRFVSRWNGSTWEHMGPERENFIIQVESDTNDNVFAIEYYNSLDGLGGGSSGNRILKWDGSSWNQIGSDSYNNPNKIVCDTNGNLYRYQCHQTLVDNKVIVSPNEISYWNGTTWTTIGTLRNGSVSCMARSSNGDIFVGGSFDTIGGRVVHHIARWNGSSWNALDAGTTESVSAIACGNNGVIYVSEFVSTNNYRIARWDGLSWSYYDNKIDGLVTSMVLSDSLLFIGGKFLNVGSVFSPYIANVKLNSGLVVSNRHDIRTPELANPQLHINNSTLFISSILPDDCINLYDLFGRCVRNAKGTFSIDIKGLSCGPYFVQIKRNGKALVSKAVIASRRQ